MEDLTKQKILLAEFMGATVTQAYAETKEQSGVMFYFLNDSPSMYKNMSSVSIRYHSSWHWLMPVVVKLRSNYYGAGESSFQLALQSALCTPTLEGVHEAVVKFVEWIKNK